MSTEEHVFSTSVSIALGTKVWIGAKSTAAAPCSSSDLQDRSCRISMLGDHEILERRASARYMTDDDTMPRCQQAVNFGSVSDFYLFSLLSTRKPRRWMYWVLGSGCHNRRDGQVSTTRSNKRHS